MTVETPLWGALLAWGLAGAVLVACAGGDKDGVPTASAEEDGDAGGEDGGIGGGGDGGPSDGEGSGGADDGEDPGPDCSDIPAPPFTVERMRGFTQSEDFVFDAEGHLISVDNSGNLVRQTIDGETSVLLPRVGEVAGIAMLPDGDIVLADVERGTVRRVAPDGGSENLATGLNYPNGVTVDAAGRVYVSEHAAGRVRQYDPSTGEQAILAEGLVYPNGLAFSPDESVLYVNSFGGATVHALPRTETGFADPTTIARIESGPPYTDPCGSLALGDTCFLSMDGIGVCTETGCTPNPDLAACAGLAEGDACATTRDTTPIDSVCAESPAGLICPRVPAEPVRACAGRSVWDPCDLGSGTDSTYCTSTWEEVPACVDFFEMEDAMVGACGGAEVGEVCAVDMDVSVFSATCESGSSLGFSGTVCLGGPYVAGTYGGLDGLDVDACGNVYVTEYITGLVYRLPAEGGEPETILDLGSQWIPNLHWGSGVGGWDRETLYVQDRMSNGIFAVDIGIAGRPLVHLSGVD